MMRAKDGPRGRRTALTALLLPALALAACSDSGGTLTVDLRTDLSPGNEFVAVRTEISTAPFSADGGLEDGDAPRSDDAIAVGEEDYVTGRRVAGFTGLPAGSAFVRVRLIDRRGDVVVERVSTVTVRGRVSMVVVVARACRGAVCPEPGGDPDATTCVAGRCVPPTCTPETPDACGEPVCATAADCTTSVACASSLCLEGACFELGDDSRCAADEWCDAVRGCVPFEAGPRCPATETACSDGRDDDCDGAIDCADPDCRGRTCDDDDPCTQDDVCGSDGGACAGTALECDDGNACTEDACDPGSGECMSAPNAASCDDGLFCNGTDTCADGSCSVHAGSPCPVSCSETTGACTECASAADCGTPPPTSWGPCEFASACATSGTQTGTTTTLSCDAGACRTTVTQSTRSCSRASREGVRCGGSTRDRCCGGTCVDTWSSESHCGGCGLRCSTGLTCTVARQGGGAACQGCDFNSQCTQDGTSQPELVTCWIMSSGGADYCRCQSDDACAPGQSCRVVSTFEADRYCYYP
ncbi:MAG: hypothetical protein M3Y87_27785 [Myxococcota bacterium]|nr:hypothetical protein [Myxococcota bacterium]